MFLFERLVGVGTYSVILVLVCLSLTNKRSKKIKSTLFFYSIILSILAFLYIPYETADLYRIYESIDIYQKYSLNSIIEIQAESSTLSPTLYWLISQTGIPQLLPALTTLICYNCIFYIIYKTAEKNQISGKNVAIALLFYMSIGNYMFVISGIRSMLGISMLAFCFYRESVERKFNIFHIPLYIISALIHPLVAVLIAIRFIISIFDPKVTAMRRFVYILLLSIGGLLAFICFKEYIDYIIQKVLAYFKNESYSYIWEYLISILVCIVILFVIFKWKSIKSASTINLHVWLYYEIALFVISLAFCYEFTIFHRITTYIMPIIALPLLMTALQRTDEQCDTKKLHLIDSIADVPLNFNSGIILISLLLLLLACSRGSLSSYKFFVW